MAREILFVNIVIVIIRSFSAQTSIHSKYTQNVKLSHNA